VNTLQINNPFGAPVYYKETVTSTMDEARLLAGHKSGTVIAAGEQSAGRGRSGRPWKMNRGENLPFTIILRYGSIQAIPRCLTLRAGLAVSLAIEDFAALVRGSELSPLANKVQIKWPNDVMLLDQNGHGLKAVGILAEAEGGTVYLGIGINIAQRSFPPELTEKACSIAQMLSQSAGQGETAADREAALLAECRYILLELILTRLHEELESSGHTTVRERLEERLYMKGRRVCFIPGLPEELATANSASVRNSAAGTPANPETIEGVLQGVSEDGEILITADTGEMLSFITGELKVYGGIIN